MAIKKCKECGKEVSTSAKVCLHCGAKLRRSAWRLMRWPVSVLGAVVGGVLTTGIWLACELPEQYIWAGALVGIVAGGTISFVIFKVITVFLGIIAVGLIFFCLFFRVVTFSNDDFTVIAKKYPTFSNTFVDLEGYIKRGNDAIEQYNSDGLKYLSRLSLEHYLRKHGIDPAVYHELWEKGLIGPKEDVADSKEIINNHIERFKNMEVAYLSDVGPTIAGTTLGKWLEQMSKGLKETAKLKIVENDSNIIVKIFSRESQASFFFSPQESNVCILTGANIDGETISSIEALQAMTTMVTP